MKTSGAFSDSVLASLLKLEESYMLTGSYFERFSGDKITPDARHTLTTWMLEVCEDQQCTDEVYSLAVNLFDRFMSVTSQCNKYHLQLYGTVCLLIASKVKSSAGSKLDAFTLVDYTANSLTVEALLDWELIVLDRLRWDCVSVVPNDFLDIFLQRLLCQSSNSSDILSNEQHVELVRKQCYVFTALCSTDFRFAFYPSSMIAGACVLVAIDGVKQISASQRASLQRTFCELLAACAQIDTECLLSLKELVDELIRQSLSADNEQQQQPQEHFESEEFRQERPVLAETTSSAVNSRRTGSNNVAHFDDAFFSDEDENKENIQPKYYGNYHDVHYDDGGNTGDDDDDFNFDYIETNCDDEDDSLNVTTYSQLLESLKSLAAEQYDDASPTKRLRSTDSVSSGSSEHEHPVRGFTRLSIDNESASMPSSVAAKQPFAPQRQQQGVESSPSHRRSTAKKTSSGGKKMKASSSRHSTSSVDSYTSSSSGVSSTGSSGEFAFSCFGDNNEQQRRPLRHADSLAIKSAAIGYSRISPPLANLLPMPSFSQTHTSSTSCFGQTRLTRSQNKLKHTSSILI